MKAEKGVVLVICGPSGSGKGTMLAKIRKDHKEYVFSVSATTRKPREGEIHGEHYFFVETEQFEKMIDNGELLEWVRYCDNYYGTPKSFVSDCISSGKNIIIEVEVEGSANIKKVIPDAVSVFIMPPSFKELKDRIEKRGSETKETTLKRLRTALSEIRFVNDYDYLIINDRLEDAINNLDSIIEAEKLKTGRRQEFVEGILKEGFNYERE